MSLSTLFQLVILAIFTSTSQLASGALREYFKVTSEPVEWCPYEETVEVVSCADPAACNFEQEGDCEYPAANLDCDGSCLNDFNNNGICDEDEVSGCEYPSACNYNPAANVGDGSCLFPESNFDCQGNCLLDINNNGLCDLDEVVGCTVADAINYNPNATLDDGTCMVTCKGDFNNDGEITLPDLLGFLASFGSVCSGGGCMNPNGCNYDPEATFDLNYCTYPAEFYDCDNICLNDADGDGVCDELEVLGCTDPEANNYDPEATNDDGSCEAPSEYPAETVFCDGTPTEVVEVLNPTTGRIWMDRNLGASAAGTAITDLDAQGDLYQWGRGADGHQCRNSPIIGTLSGTDQPGHGSFIFTNGGNYDWRNPQSIHLWQGLDGTNNPCPTGYRVPTSTECLQEELSWESEDIAGAFNSPLKWVSTGRRNGTNGNILGTGSANNWTSTPSTIVTTTTFSFTMSSNTATITGNNRADGRAVRCIKHE